MLQYFCPGECVKLHICQYDVQRCNVSLQSPKRHFLSRTMPIKPYPSMFASSNFFGFNQ